MSRPKTIFCDLDGTVVKHSNPIEIQNPNYYLQVLPGVHEKLIEWDNNHATTGERTIAIVQSKMSGISSLVKEYR